MRHSAIKLPLVGIAVIGLAMTLAAFAVADSSGGNGNPSSEPPAVVPVQGTRESSGATSEPPPSAPSSPTNSATPLAEVPKTEPAIPDTAGATVDAGGPTGDEEGESEAGSIEGTTPALNPGGHCIELPNDSDVVRNPEKHPNWVVGRCEPRNEPPEGEEQPGEGGPPEGRTPSMNPDGVCVSMPNNSDIVRNPDKHPNWVVGGCQLSAE